MTAHMDSPPTSSRLGASGWAHRALSSLSVYLWLRVMPVWSKLSGKCGRWLWNLARTLAGMTSRYASSPEERLSLVKALTANLSVGFAVSFDSSAMREALSRSGGQISMPVVLPLSAILGGTATTKQSLPPRPSIQSTLDPFASGLSPTERGAVNSIMSSVKS